LRQSVTIYAKLEIDQTSYARRRMTMTGLPSTMAKRPLSPGQRVSVLDPKPPLEPGRINRITRVLPTERGARLRYCVKSDAEVFERVFDEAALEIADYD
jgi:hypothetical protein